MFSFGLSSRLKSISNIRQSSRLWHFYISFDGLCLSVHDCWLLIAYAPPHVDVGVDSWSRHSLDHTVRSDAVVQPVYISRKIKGQFKPKEHKLPIVNQQNVVYYYTCGLYQIYQIRTGMFRPHHELKTLETKSTSAINSRFSHDVTTAMLVPLNKEKAAMLVPRPNPPGI